MNKKEIAKIMEEQSNEFCVICNEYASTRGVAPSIETDGDSNYWKAYNEKWDEICPGFNPMTGRGYESI